MENTYNKIQYSEFTDNGKLNGNGQWVIRTETYTEAMAILEQIRKGTPGSTLPATVVTPTQQNTPFVPQAPKTYNVNSQTATEAQNSTTLASPACPECGGVMWNNIPKKQSGQFNLAAPDYKCKNKDCSGVIWPPKNRKGVVADGSNY